MHDLVVRVPAMTCRHVARQVSAVVSDADGVRTVHVDVAARSVRVRGDIDPGAVVAVLRAAGYEAELHRGSDASGAAGA